MTDLEDENGPIGPSSTSPESPCSKNNSKGNNNNNKEQDRFLPIANVGRIMKKVLPGNGKISKDAKETVQECVSEFISFVTGEASDKCQREKRKTINGDDIIWAITTLGFDDYVKPLKQYLNNYKEHEGEKLNSPNKQQQQQQRSSDQQGLQGGQDHNTAYIISQTSFATGDHQPFSLSFSPTAMQPQLHQPEQIDTVGHW
ncbi:Transcription factor CBF/NF-Y/archaeal histone domain [Dillenia turbinata]|uniref:Transcription factor CBF/NF-Y/archaeal histone domain n=1 Tax=Dillenia turbinata TaxID=194707 RepID=A0AAN8V6C6_9MAGN